MNTKQKWLARFEEYNLGANTLWYQIDQLEQFLLKLGYGFEIQDCGGVRWHIVNVEKNDNPRYIPLSCAVKVFNGILFRFSPSFTDCIGLKEKLWFTAEQWQAAQSTKEIAKVKLYKSAKDGWKVYDNWVKFI